MRSGLSALLRLDIRRTQGTPCPKGDRRVTVTRRRKRTTRLVVRGIRAQLVEAAHERCARCHRYCGDDGHAHHRVPRSLGGPWTLANLEYLCPRCHGKAHA